MIDLSQAPSAGVHAAATDPGVLWTRAGIAIEAPPDDDLDPAPDARWPAQAVRTGICGAVSPRVVALTGGGYRLYYSQILPRPGFPAGANDYDNSSTRILSAVSDDGLVWTPEPGVRLAADEGGAGAFRVVSSDVVPMTDGSGRLRMYYECCAGPQSLQNSIRSAWSADGLAWTPEPGVRFESSGRSYSAPRVVLLGGGRCRLYCGARGTGIVSAWSDDGGLSFHADDGLRIAQDTPHDRLVAFAPEMITVGGGYVMYYAGYSAANRAQILRAESDDGLHWRKVGEPVLAPDGNGCDAVKCSEMCVLRLPGGDDRRPRYRMLYEACDGTAADQRGVWRIAAADTAI